MTTQVFVVIALFWSSYEEEKNKAALRNILPYILAIQKIYFFNNFRHENKFRIRGGTLTKITKQYKN